MTPPVDFVVTHELAHEWWYALISDDQAQAPWLDEAFASYAEEAAGAQQRPWCRRPGPARASSRAARRTSGAGATPATARSTPRARACSTCCASAWAARVFDAALRDYALANRYGWSTAAEFRAAMDAASPVPLDDLWRRYRRSVGRRPRAVARVGLVARLAAAVPERVVDRGRRRRPRARPRAARPRAARRRGSRPPRASRARSARRGRSARPAPGRTRARRRSAARAERGCRRTASARRRRRPARCPAGAGRRRRAGRA